MSASSHEWVEPISYDGKAIEGSEFSPRLQLNHFLACRRGTMPICYLHAGTHKTGTTALQRMLALNERLLADAGVYVPRTGRMSLEFGSHHPIAWELNGSERFDPAQGSLHDLVREVAASGAQTVVVSSEDFEQLHRKPEKIRTFVERFAEIGYVVKPIFFLRPQAEYFEAIYADAIRNGAVFRFEWLMGDVFDTGAYCDLSNDALAFEYSKLLDAFAAVAGTANVVVRRYSSRAGTDRIVRDFLRTITTAAPNVPAGLVEVPPRLNTSLTFGDLLRQLSCNREAHGFDPIPLPVAPDLEHRVDFLHYEESRAFVRRFGRDNRIVAKKYGVRVPPVGAREYADDVRTKLGLNRASRARRAALDATSPWLPFMPTRS